MSESDANNAGRSWYAQPWFLASAGGVAALTALAIVVSILGVTGGDEEGGNPPPVTQTSAPASAPPETSGAEDRASVCGLEDGESESGRLAAGPDVTWNYQGTMAVPASQKYGPGDTSSDGIRFCYQRSPEGALLAAANGAAHAADPQTLGAWLEHSLAAGEAREQILRQGANENASSPSGMRLDIKGFRVLDYSGDTARIDLGLEGVAEGDTVTLSMVYDLIWEDGDWKLLVEDPNAPINVAVVPNLSGYTTWEA